MSEGPVQKPEPVRPVPVAGVMDVPPYIQGASCTESTANPIKLSSNENPYGPGPKALEAMRAALKEVHLYPEGNATALAQALSGFWGVPAERIATATGSDSMLPVVMRAFLAPGDEGLYFSDAFPKFRTYAIGQGSLPIEVPRDKNTDYTIDPDALARALTPKTRMVYLDNPGNPTGVATPAKALRDLHAVLPGDVILILDEAYAEFSDIGDAGLRLASEADNVVVQRTFSKAFGLAGLRIGWSVAAPGIIDAVLKLRPSFPLSVPAIAGALAALEDGEYMRQSVAAIRATRSRTVTALRAAGWHIPEPAGNFFMLRSEGAPIDIDAAMAALNAQAVLVRPYRIQGDEPVIRITVGTDEEMQPVIDALT